MKTSLASSVVVVNGCVALKEGENVVDVAAVDEAGNKANARFPFTLVEREEREEREERDEREEREEREVERGSAGCVDGQRLPVDTLAGWRLELSVTSGRRTVEIVATDPNGNKKIERCSIGVE